MHLTTPPEPLHFPLKTSRATQEKFTYLHRWRVGGLVMYDNRAVLHRARPYAITTHPRVLHRTTVASEGPTAE